MNVTIINGPNLNLLGKRQTDVYGDESFDSYLIKLKTEFPEIDIVYFQSNIEGEMIDKIHEAGFKDDAIIINAGGYSHTSVAIGDAVASIKSPVYEVHISNIFARESFRHHSFLSAHCKAVIAGGGLQSYRLALIHIRDTLS